jgi:lipoate---protein ligase
LQEREVLVYSDNSRDPSSNLTRESEIFEMVDRGALPEVLRFWVNSSCLVKGPTKTGKYGWYNEKLAEAMGIPVITRSSGGGVVYHDEGNLNWSFFLRTAGSFLAPRAAYELGSKHIISALESLGAEALFAPPNRIDVRGHKVSGMAARSTPRALLVHGTLLLNSDLDRLNALCVPPRDCPPVANLSRWVKGITAKAVEGAVITKLSESGLNPRRVEQVDPEGLRQGSGPEDGTL